MKTPSSVRDFFPPSPRYARGTLLSLFSRFSSRASSSRRVAERRPARPLRFRVSLINAAALRARRGIRATGPRRFAARDASHGRTTMEFRAAALRAPTRETEGWGGGEGTGRRAFPGLRKTVLVHGRADAAYTPAQGTQIRGMSDLHLDDISDEAINNFGWWNVNATLGQREDRARRARSRRRPSNWKYSNPRSHGPPSHPPPPAPFFLSFRRAPRRRWTTEKRLYRFAQISPYKMSRRTYILSNARALSRWTSD